MSRQVRATTEIVVKNTQSLDWAIEQTCKELDGVKVQSVRYYAGKIYAGISVNDIEVAIVINEADQKLEFRGEEYAMKSDVGKKIMNAVKKHYTTRSIEMVMKRTGYSVQTLPVGRKVKIMGVR